jgi:hypothetical protein
MNIIDNYFQIIRIAYYYLKKKMYEIKIINLL